MASNPDPAAAGAAAIPAPLSDSPDHLSSAFPAAGAASPVKKPTAAWKRPANGATEVAAAAPVMDVESWPALCGSAAGAAKSSPKPSPSSSSSGPVISPMSLINSDHAAPVRDVPTRSGALMPANDGPEKQVARPEPSPRMHIANRNSGGGPDHHGSRFTPHPHGRGGGYGGGGGRRGSGGNGNGGRRGQEHHGGFDGHRRGMGGRDGHGPMHQPRGPRSPFLRGPPPVAVSPPPPPQFVGGPPPPPVPPFGSPIGFPEMAAPIYYFPMPPPPEVLQGGMSFVPHPANPPPILIPQIDSVQTKLLMQIEYYFSPENLCKDIYLRQNMDENGWVSLSLIAGFNKVKQITEDLRITNISQFIIETIRLSSVVELQGDKIRRRSNWENWLLPRRSHATGTASGSLAPMTSNIDALASRFQTVGLEGMSNHISMQGMPGEAILTRSATSGSLSYQLQKSGNIHGAGSGQFIGSKPARSLFRSDTL